MHMRVPPESSGRLELRTGRQKTRFFVNVDIDSTIAVDAQEVLLHSLQDISHNSVIDARPNLCKEEVKRPPAAISPTLSSRITWKQRTIKAKAALR